MYHETTASPSGIDGELYRRSCFSLYRLVFGGFGGALRGLDLVAEPAGCLDPAWILFPADKAAALEFRRVVASFGEFLCDFGNFLNLV